MQEISQARLFPHDLKKLVLKKTLRRKIKDTTKWAYESRAFNLLNNSEDRSFTVGQRQAFLQQYHEAEKNFTKQHCPVCFREVNQVLKHLAKNPLCKQTFPQAELLELQSAAKKRNEDNKGDQVNESSQKQVFPHPQFTEILCKGYTQSF